ncbi:MAG: winged helix-turn-helix domain-containing protein [Microbacteriaceae bacterium]
MPENPENNAQLRGFALYVGIDDATAEAAGTTIAELVATLRKTIDEQISGVDSHVAVAYAPPTQRGKNLDIVRLALREPKAVAELLPPKPETKRVGVEIDLSRKRVVINDETSPLTYKEFELLQYLVLREGVTVDRSDIIDTLWSASDVDRPNTRTIDVHVRRLRSKLEPFEDIVRTVRGIGYRFDRHADVTINYGTGRSPDVF